MILNANATRGDRVVLELDSPGGTVTGYGFAAAQLGRLKGAGLHLTACVTEVRGGRPVGPPRTKMVCGGVFLWWGRGGGGLLCGP